jgi:L,D-peptidoglycan transpeptidase YkuD (ErfK/YbiS/YcfS/YnhG family)
MIIVKRSENLLFKKLKFKCSLGKNGVTKNKVEGDKCTPSGIYRLKQVFYRADRINKITTNLKKIKIKKNMGWCDDPSSKRYNRLIKIPYKFSHEKLYRKDHIYDIVVILNYNMNPVVKKKGSAIFMHITKKNYLKTLGCIALKKNDLLEILNKVKKDNIIKII